MARSLLLNASFEPLCVVSSRRAVVLVLKDKAEIVHRNGAEFRSERRTVPVPSVIRLVHFVRVPYRATAPLSRRAVFAARPPPVPVLRQQRREPGPHRPALARRPPHVGERRRLVSRLQRPQRGPAPLRVRDGAAPCAARAARDHVADRVGRPDRPALAAVPRALRSRTRLSGERYYLAARQAGREAEQHVLEPLDLTPLPLDLAFQLLDPREEVAGDGFGRWRRR